MNKELQLRAAALRWSQTHDNCADAHDACPVRKECSRYIDLLCSPRAAADLIESLAAELGGAKHEASQLRRELSWDKFPEAMGE